MSEFEQGYRKGFADAVDILNIACREMLKQAEEAHPEKATLLTFAADGLTKAAEVLARTLPPSDGHR
jgi:hypothetical protein